MEHTTQSTCNTSENAVPKSVAALVDELYLAFVTFFNNCRTLSSSCATAATATSQHTSQHM